MVEKCLKTKEKLWSSTQVVLIFWMIWPYSSTAHKLPHCSWPTQCDSRREINSSIKWAKTLSFYFKKDSMILHCLYMASVSTKCLLIFSLTLLTSFQISFYTPSANVHVLTIMSFGLNYFILLSLPISFPLLYPQTSPVIKAPRPSHGQQSAQAELVSLWLCCKQLSKHN